MNYLFFLILSIDSIDGEFEEDQKHSDRKNHYRYLIAKFKENHKNNAFSSTTIRNHEFDSI